jgi:hypothetical protein
MSDWLIRAVSFVFGVLPATYLAFWAAMLLLAVPFAMLSVPLDAEMLAKTTWPMLGATCGIVGYVSLFRAVLGGVMTSRVAQGLLLGIAANAYGFYLVFDLSSYAMRQWSDWCWLASPTIVALWHVGAFYIGRRRFDRRSS